MTAVEVGAKDTVICALEQSRRPSCEAAEAPCSQSHGYANSEVMPGVVGWEDCPLRRGGFISLWRNPRAVLVVSHQMLWTQRIPVQTPQVPVIPGCL